MNKIFPNPRLKSIFKAMKTRCYNHNSDSYENYGGKGIGICPEWLNDSSVFVSWSLANGYDDSLTIDRIDSDADYSPDNCRWVSKEIQNRNRNSVYYATINGETKCVTEWCNILGLHVPTITTRIRKGMSPYDALTIPVNHAKGRYKK